MRLGIGLSLTRQRILGSAFSPSDISNLDLWYDFSTISGSTGDNVTSFANAGLGGSNYNLSQSTADDYPTLNTSEMGLNCLDFQSGSTTLDDSLDLANTYTTTGQTFSIFVVYEISATGDTDTFLGGSSGGVNQFGVYNQKNITLRCNGEGGVSTNAVVNIRTDNTDNSSIDYEVGTDQEILVLTRDASEVIKVYNKNGALICQGTSTTTHAETNLGIAHIGSLSSGASPVNGFIGEIGVYNKTLDATEVSNLTTHLKDKWSVS